MATTQNTFTGNGSNLGPFSFTFKWLESTDIKVTVGGVLKTAGTHYNLQSLNYTTKTGGQVLFTAGNAPANGASIRIYRDTDDEALSAVFSSGSAIRAKDLNDNFTQNLYVTQETNNNSLNVDGSNPMVGDLNMGGYKVINLATPTVSTDASTKGYVDSVVATGAANAAAAASSATAAASSATAAATSLDTFDDRYLGTKASDPVVDNDGNALITGAMYFNTTANRTKVYNGTIWVEAGVPGSLVRWTKTAAGGQTSLSGNDDNSNALNYTPGSEQVFLNGALLTSGVDYIAATNTTITGLVALTAGDVVDVLSLNQYVVGTVSDQSVTNAKVAAGAGIAASKLSFTQTGTGAVARTVDSKLKDAVSVKDFGAVGDGVADDTAAIQAAINAVFPRGSILFPEGTYITGPITVDGAGTLALIELYGVGGMGNGSIIRAKAGVSNTNLFTFVDSTTTIKNLSFEADLAAFMTALEFRGSNNNGYEVVDNCFFSGYFSAVTLRTDAYRVVDCYSINCTNFVIGANWAMNGYISGNNILGGQKSVWLTRDVTDPSPQQAEGVRIVNNTFLNTEANAQPILINAGLEIYIGNNIIDQTGLNGTGIDLTPIAGSAISYIKIVDNWIDAGDGANGACITGNSSVAGTDVSRVWIERNTFRGGAAIDSIIDKPTIYLNSVNTYWIIDNGLLSETSVAAVLNPGAVNGLILGNHSRVTSPETSLETNTWNKGLNFASTYSLSVAGTEVQTINSSGNMTLKSAGAGTVTFLTYGGDPENNVTANPGSICLRTDTGLLYVKQGTGTGNTGWVSK